MAREFSVIIERDAEGYFVASVPAPRRVREAVELCVEVQGEAV